MISPESQPPILVLCRDLLLASKITSTAAAGSIRVKVVRDILKLREEAESRRLLVDLNQAGFLDAAAEWKRITRGQVVGFVGHTDTEMIARAQAANLDAVLTRGQFVAQLHSILITPPQ